MIPAEARDIFLYYGGAIFLLLVLFMYAGRKRKGMRLRLKAGARATALDAESGPDNLFHIHGRQNQAPAPGGPARHEQFSHVQPAGERPLNVVFNYNGHSWDAYEVLGLPAGSSPDKVEQAYRETLQSVDAGSRAFMEAAYHAIQAEWKSYKAAGNR